MRTRRLSTVLALSATLIAAGCGSGSPTPSAKAPKPGSGAAYAQAANKICREIAAVAPQFPGQRDSAGGLKTTAAQVVPYLQEVSSLSKQSLARMRTLEPPRGQKAKVARLLEVQRARVKSLEDALAAARKGDGKRFTAAFQQDQKVNAPRYTRAAAALGLTACGA